MGARRKAQDVGIDRSNALWFKDAVIYETHVRAFHDSNGDGIGDFPGLVEKLDYLADLGVDTLWLLPFYPSPLKDDGYDIASYVDIHQDYGTIQEFKTFLREAHRRGLRVITELVVNHTSDQHEWFKRARTARPDSRARNFYVWSDSPEKYRGTRIIFQDFEHSNWAWDPVAKSYYWHRFYSHQPDLNFDNPAVRKAILQLVDFWLGMGVDGLRLDAVPYLFEREGTNCENLPETHEFLKQLRRHVDRNFTDRMLLAEANQWPEDAAAYFGDGDQCHMNFHFPLMPRLFMAVRMEDRFPIIDILEQTPSIPHNCQWALFLRNHDELTLEMVTDEDRDYMYRVYAQDPQMRINVGIRRRLAPLLGSDRRRIELLNGLLFSLPGTPILYYGDEIGMGDNIYLGDRNGVRTPMQWSPDRNAGFSRANPQGLYLPVIIDPEYHYEATNVEAQQNNTHSLLWWTKRLIALRKRFKAFGHGTIEFLHPENRRVLAFIRQHEDERILVLVNLSRFTQYVELDMQEDEGAVPIELFSGEPFPPIGELPYFFTLSPHAFYWFQIQSPEPSFVARETVSESIPDLEVRGSWARVIEDDDGAALRRVLPRYLQAARWFGGKARSIAGVDIEDVVPLGGGRTGPQLLLVNVRYRQGDPETYQLPLAFAEADAARAVENERPHAILARLTLRPRERDRGEIRTGVLYDPLGDEEFGADLLDFIVRRRRLAGQRGEVRAAPTRALRRLWPKGEPAPTASPMRVEQSNTSVLYDDTFVLKLFRRLVEGTNPDLEIGRFLTEKTSFAHTAPVAGAFEYTRRRHKPVTLGILQGFVENEGDVWRYTLDAVGRYFDEVLARPVAERAAPSLELLSAIMERPQPEDRDWVCSLVGTYLDDAELMGRRVAELHLALSSRADDPDFAPEDVPPHYRRSLYQSVRNQVQESLDLLRRRTRTLPDEARAVARRVLDQADVIDRRLRALLRNDVTAKRIRVHGDLHLGQLLSTGRDFVIIDFEGEPAHSIGIRRLKRSPMRDVAGMLRSFHYASLHEVLGDGRVREEDRAEVASWAQFWVQEVWRAFLAAYVGRAAQGPFMPESEGELGALLEVYLIEKVAYEIRYELNNRPDWTQVPLIGLLQLIEE
jgi:maltose alpha-D-glucosyltransferase/alpha-amylase